MTKSFLLPWMSSRESLLFCMWNFLGFLWSSWPLRLRATCIPLKETETLMWSANCRWEICLWNSARVPPLVSEHTVGISDSCYTVRPNAIFTIPNSFQVVKGGCGSIGISLGLVICVGASASQCALIYGQFIMHLRGSGLLVLCRCDKHRRRRDQVVFVELLSNNIFFRTNIRWVSVLSDVSQ
jgi:hypothetical protein